MKYEILDSVRVKRTRFELLTDGKLFYVAKIVGERVTFLYSNRKQELTVKFFERTIGEH